MEELFDVLDEKGRKTGKALRRSLIHKRGLWHYGTDVWLYNSKGEVLVQKRSMRKITNPGLWTGSTTCHVSAGETPRQAAIRELKEEIGVEAKPGDLREIIQTTLIEEIGQQYHNREHLYVFLYKRDIDVADMVLQKEEVDAVKFLPYRKFRKEILDPKLSRKFTKNVYYPELIKKLDRMMKAVH